MSADRVASRPSLLQQGIRRFVRTWLLPVAIFVAYLALADRDYAAKFERANAISHHLIPSYASFSEFLQSPPTTYQISTLVVEFSSLVGSSRTVLREIIFFGLTWVFYYGFIHVLYYLGGWAMRQMFFKFKPSANNLKLSTEAQWEQILHSEKAFPLYCVVPTVGDVLRHHGFSQMTDSFAECGGFARSLFNFTIYMFLVEGGVFFVHYWMLHKWPWGKKYLNHDDHHKYVHEDEMTTWSGFAFEAIDGTLQGVPFVLFQFVVPVPEFLGITAGALVGIWTMYIHVAEPALPWPFMGADYHSIHHIYNWNNFGLFTQLWDWLFGTLRHPDSNTRKFAEETRANRKNLAQLHQMFGREKTA
ncbi:hypothetical protein AAMO2058_000670100 [Amorphochlora amoebiformis]